MRFRAGAFRVRRQWAQCGGLLRRDWHRRGLARAAGPPLWTIPREGTDSESTFQMIRRVLLNVSTLLVSIILSLVLLEVVLRFYNPIIQTVKGDRVVLRVNYDVSQQNKTHIPGIAPEIHIHQNSVGFRGADPPADLEDRLSIITVGGSTTHSATQSDNHTWTDLLGDAVSDCFDRTWINNAGFDGHTSFAHIQLIRNYINKLHPKVVVMLIGVNDLMFDGQSSAYDR
jgi:hypothetical protein